MLFNETSYDVMVNSICNTVDTAKIFEGRKNVDGLIR